MPVIDDPYLYIAAHVLLQAIEDARAGDAQARAWLEADGLEWAETFLVGAGDVQRVVAAEDGPGRIKPSTHKAGARWGDDGLTDEQRAILSALKTTGPTGVVRLAGLVGKGAGNVFCQLSRLEKLGRVSRNPQSKVWQACARPDSD